MSRKPPGSRTRDLLEDLPFYVNRTYYEFLGLLERRLAALGLDKHMRPGMGSILFALLEKDDCIIKDIRERTRLSPSTLTGLLSRMEAARLIARVSDGADARAQRVRLTPLGRSIGPRLHELHAGLLDVMHARLSGDEVDQLRDLLARVIASMQEDGARSGAARGQRRNPRA